MVRAAARVAALTRLGPAAARLRPAAVGLLTTAVVLLVALPPAMSQDSSRRVAARPLVGLKADAVTLILEGTDGGPIRAEGLVVPLVRTPEGLLGVGLWLEIDSSTLLAASETNLPIEFFAYAIDAQGNVATHLSQFVDIRLDEIDAAALGNGIRFVGHLEGLHSKNYRIRVLIRQPDARRFALMTLPLDASATELSQIVIPRPRADWLRLDETPYGARTIFEALQVLESGSLSPAPAPTLSSLSDAVAWLVGPSAADLPISGWRLADDDSGSITEIAGIEMGIGAPDPRAFRIAGKGLQRGIWRLGAQGGGPDAILSATVRIVDQEDAPDWSGLEIEREPATQNSVAELAEQKSNAKKINRVANTYSEVLRRLAAGYLDEAPEDLTRMELEVIDALGQEGLPILEEAESRVIASLARIDPENLVPILMLHLLSHRSYLNQKVFTLLAHAGEMVEAVAEVYADTATGEMAGAIAADALATLGADLQSARARPQALRVFERALDLNPRNSFARLSQAIGNEGSGLYAEAIASLRELLLFAPSFEEGRLRIGINLHRIGESTEAMSYLRELLPQGTTPWIRSLAYQELARIYLDSGRPESAGDLLRSAIGQMPDQQRLMIELAYAFDRAGRIAESSEIMLRAETADTHGGATARSRYNAQISVELEATERSLISQSLTRLANLSAALGPS